MTTCNLVGKFIIPVCDNRVAKMHTGSGRGALGSVLLFMRIAPDHESPKVKQRATTKAACSAAVPMSPWMSLSLGIQ
jgi:hypothetical protein